MTKPEALYSFWDRFGWIVVDEQSLYDEHTMADLGDPSRYISYESGVGELEDTLTLSVDLWHKSTAWTTVEAKAAEIYNAIGYGGILIPYDGGVLWIKRNQYRRMEAAENVRRIHFEINAEFLSV